MINPLTRLTRLTRRTPSVTPAPAPPPTAEDLFADAEAAEAARLVVEERARLREAELAASLAAAEGAAKVAALEHKSELERRRREAKLAEDHERAAERQRLADLDARRAKRAEAARGMRVKIATFGERARRLAVNVVVNVGAGYGQAAYFAKHLAVPLPVAVMLAAGLELIAVTTLDYGLAARKAGRPHKIKFAAAALLAVLVAYLNHSHWSATRGQEGLAVPLAILSLLAPLLWAWYAAARDAETAPASDLVGRATSSSKITTRRPGTATSGDNKIAKFTAAQWLMWPRQTFTAKRAAIRYMITDPEAAYRAAAQHAADKEAAHRDTTTVTAEVIKDAEARAAAAETRAAEAERLMSETREALAATQAALDTAQRRELDQPATPMRYLPTSREVADMTDAEKRDSAEDAYRQARLDGVDIPGGLLGEVYGMSSSWGRDRRRRVKDVMRLELAPELDEDDEPADHDAAANG